MANLNIRRFLVWFAAIFFCQQEKLYLVDFNWNNVLYFIRFLLKQCIVLYSRKIFILKNNWLEIGIFFWLYYDEIKGHLISKFPYENQFHPKYQRKYFWNSALKFFVASWGLPGDLVFNIINKGAYRKPPGRFKKFQGRNPEIISLVFLCKQ